MKLLYCCIAAIFTLSYDSSSATGQIAEPANLFGDSTQTRKRLTEAEEKLIAGKAADATDDLQRILDETPNDLIAISSDGKQYQTAQWRAQIILAKLPPAALKNYQDQIETPARKLLETAKLNRDPATLWQLIDKYFVSRPADEGLLLLGDILFERGEFRTAELLWNRLLPDSGGDLIYPGSKTAPALVRARIILAAIFQGDWERAKTDLSVFKVQYPEARGSLAGKDGLLAIILAERLKAPPNLSLSPNAGIDWPTFGGGPDHAASVGTKLPAGWNHRPTLSKSLPSAKYFDGSRSLRAPFGHPIVVNGQVFVTNGLRLYGFDLLTGNKTAEERYSDHKVDGRAPEPCPTLSAAGNKLYVRIGPVLFKAPNSSEKPEESKIICYEVGNGSSKELKHLWSLPPPKGDDKTTTIWEGAPQVSGRKMWAAYARFEGGRIVHGIACYDPADANVEPEQRWVKDVCDSQTNATSDNRTRQELVTIVGRKVIFCSNTGVVVALDASTGARAWAFRYPRSSKINPNRSSDPASPVAYGGRVFVAPTDTDRVYALDSEAGKMLWESEILEGAQIVGVAAGRVVVTSIGEFHGIRGLNVENGSYHEPDGWFHYNKSAPLSHGRGFVTEERVFSPTSKGLRVYRSNDGKVCQFSLNDHNGSPSAVSGNIIYADGMLIVVTTDRLWVYYSNEKEFGPANQKLQGDPVQMQFQRLSANSELLISEGKTVLARQQLTEMARSELPTQYRAWAAARLLLLAPKVDSENKLPDYLRSVLTPDLRNEWVFQAHGIPTTLETMLQQHLGREPPHAIPQLKPKSMVVLRKVEAPALDSDAEIERTIRLATGSAPLQWISGSKTPRNIHLTTSTELHVYSLANGEQSKHDAVDSFTHVAEMPNGFLAAGPHSIALYGADRIPTWVFRVPVAALLPSHPGEYRMFTDQAISPPELSAFHLCGPWLVALLGERHLISIDLWNRRVAWVLSTSGKRGFNPSCFPEDPHFGSEISVNSRFIVVQLSSGKRWLIRTESGRVLDVPGFGNETAHVRWTSAPAEIASNYLAVPDGPVLIRLLNLSTGRVKWTHSDTRGTSSLAGDPVQIRSWDELLLVAIRRNHGVELDRLGLFDGKSKWDEGPAFLDASRLRLADADVDNDRIYLPVGNTLVAIELKNGKILWEAVLPDLHGVPGWIARAGQKCAIVYPREAIPREDPVDVALRMLRKLRTNPELWRLPALAFGLYDAWVARSLPILMFDLETGKALGKIEVPAKGPAVNVCFDRDRAVVVTGDRICWLK